MGDIIDLAKYRKAKDKPSKEGPKLAVYSNGQVHMSDWDGDWIALSVEEAYELAEQLARAVHDGLGMDQDEEDPPLWVRYRTIKEDPRWFYSRRRLPETFITNHTVRSKFKYSLMNWRRWF